MADSIDMQVFDDVEQLLEDSHDKFLWKTGPSLFEHEVLKRVSLDELHDNHQLTTLLLMDAIKNLNHSWVAKRL